MKSILKNPLTLTLVALALVLLAVLVIIGPPPPKTSIKVVYPPNIIASLPIWIAQEQGYFDDPELAISYLRLHDSKLMVEAFLQGDADILPAVSLADLIKTGHDKGAIYKSLLFSHSRMKKSPAFESLLVPHGSSIASLKDLEGTTIAVYPGITSETVVRHYLRQHAVDVSTIVFVKLSPPEHFTQLSAGNIQCSHSYEPFRSRNLANGRTREISPSLYASLGAGAVGVSAMSKAFYDDNTSSARAFLDAWDKAIAFIEANPAESHRILSTHLQIEEDVARDATWVDATATTDTSADDIEETVEALRAVGLVSEGFVFEPAMVLHNGRPRSP